MYRAANNNNNQVFIPLPSYQDFIEYVSNCPKNNQNCVYFQYVKETGDYSIRNFRISEIKNRAPLQEVEDCLFQLECCVPISSSTITC